LAAFFNMMQTKPMRCKSARVWTNLSQSLINLLNAWAQTKELSAPDPIRGLASGQQDEAAPGLRQLHQFEPYAISTDMMVMSIFP
jgi:hypothetical protein